ncbi:MAG: alpha/beta fold hydrolase [Bacteroidota bacterium]
MKEDLLLLHGALGSRRQFGSILPLLQDRFRVHTLDFEGHGAFNSDSDFSINRFTENVLTFLDQSNLDHINIFGYSMGGYVALNTALMASDQIGKIVTLGTKFNWNIETAEKEVKMLDAAKIEEKVPSYAIKLRDEHSQDWKEVLRKTAEMMIGLSEGSKLTREDFSMIRHEVTIGVGSLDNMVTWEESERVSKWLPNGALQNLPDFKHPIEKVDRGKLVDFIHLGLS